MIKADTLASVGSFEASAEDAIEDILYPEPG